MSDFEKEVQRKIDEAQRIDDRLNAQHEAGEAAKPIIFERFTERLREAAALLVERGIQPEVTKNVIQYRERKRWLARQAVKEPISTTVSGWMLGTPYTSYEDTRRTAWDGSPVWVSGTFMGTDGHPYKIVKNTEAELITSYNQLELPVGGFIFFQNMQVEDIAKKAEALEDLVTTTTARAIRGEPFEPEFQHF